MTINLKHAFAFVVAALTLWLIILTVLVLNHSDSTASNGSSYYHKSYTPSSSYNGSYNGSSSHSSYSPSYRPTPTGTQSDCVSYDGDYTNDNC